MTTAQNKSRTKRASSSGSRSSRRITTSTSRSTPAPRGTYIGKLAAAAAAASAAGATYYKYGDTIKNYLNPKTPVACITRKRVGKSAPRCSMTTRQTCRNTPTDVSLPYAGLTCDKALKKHALAMSKKEKEEDTKRKQEAEAKKRTQEAKKEDDKKRKQEAEKEEEKKRKQEVKKRKQEAEEKRLRAIPKYTPPFLIRQMLRISDMPIEVPRDSVYSQIAALKTQNDVKMWKKKNLVPYYALSNPTATVAVMGALAGVFVGAGYFGPGVVKNAITFLKNAGFTRKGKAEGGGDDASTLDRDLINLVDRVKIHKWFQTSTRWVGLELLMRPDFKYAFLKQAAGMGLLTGLVGKGLQLLAVENLGNSGHNGPASQNSVEVSSADEIEAGHNGPAFQNSMGERDQSEDITFVEDNEIVVATGSPLRLRSGVVVTPVRTASGKLAYRRGVFSGFTLLPENGTRMRSML